MENYLIQASTDGINLDFETIITDSSAPCWFDVMSLCTEHGCGLWECYSLDSNGDIVNRVC